jgi:phasin family protein
MAFTPKKKAAGKVEPAPAATESGNGRAKPRAAVVASRASADDAATSAKAAAPAAKGVAETAVVESVVEVEQKARAVLDKGVVETRAAWLKAKTAVDEAASAFEISFAAAKDGAFAINAKALEALRANADANFDFLMSAFAAKSVPDLIRLQTEFARKQVEAMTDQTKNIGALAQKTMAQAVEPIKEQVEKSFKVAV